MRNDDVFAGQLMFGGVGRWPASRVALLNEAGWPVVGVFGCDLAASIARSKTFACESLGIKSAQIPRSVAERTQISSHDLQLR